MNVKWSILVFHRPRILCSFFMWDSRIREKHWVERKTSNLVHDPNILHEPLVDIFPPLPKKMKLGLMKQFVKALPIEGDCFK